VVQQATRRVHEGPWGPRTIPAPSTRATRVAVVSRGLLHAMMLTLAEPSPAGNASTTLQMAPG
jgi:hypothetical protein